MNINNIIFDLGGVLLNVDYERPIEEFRKLGLKVEESWYSKKEQAPIFDALEKGEITPAEFRNEVRKKSPHPLTDEEIDRAWCSILLDFPKRRIDLLYELKKTHRLFMLSNTNAIHTPAFYAILENTFGKNVFGEVFERCYYSHETRMRKPDPAIFTMVLEANKLRAEETFFIDDSPQHVEGARKAGLHAEWLDVKKQDVVDFIKNSRFI